MENISGDPVDARLDTTADGIKPSGRNLVCRYVRKEIRKRNKDGNVAGGFDGRDVRFDWRDVIDRRHHQGVGPTQ